MTVVCQLVTDGNGVITEASPEAASVLAIQPRWLVQKPLAAFVAEPDRQRFRTLVSDLGTGRTSESAGSFVLESRDGAELSAELFARRVQGALAWRVAVEADTATEIQSLATIPGAERLFERLLNRLPDGILVVDRNLRVVYANPSARRLLGAESALRSGDELPDLWPDASLRELAQSLFSQRPQAGSHLVETAERTLCVEGLSATHSATATLLVADVTERERLRAAERQFVENAAHELRTPLAAIVSVIDVLDRGAKDDPQTRDRFLAHIRVHSERLVRLAGSLLTLARIQTGREKPRLDLVPVHELLSELASRLIPDGGVEVEVRVPAGVGVLADPDLLYQALENVAGNAVKHTREGTIVLEARDLGRTVEIDIVDTGVGMEPTEAAHAFDRFYRASPHEQNGFGLGLAIAEETIHVLGGTIELSSSRRRGTRVRIHLPSARIVAR